MQIVIPRSEFFQKGFVHQHTRKGKTVGPYFTKRLPGKVKEKHTRERFHDHDKASAKKAHDELESKKEKSKLILQALKTEHKKLTKEGPIKDEKIPHGDKLSHLKQHIKNEEQHIDNHSRKQGHIKNRYVIAGKQHEAKRAKSELEKKIEPHSEAQKETIRKIHEHGKDTHETGRVLSGKDKDHVYLERKNKETGETKHIAIHKDGEIKDPNILHEGKFDSKTLTDKQAQAEKKQVVVKMPEKKEAKTSKDHKVFPKKMTFPAIQKYFHENDVKKGMTFQLGDAKGTKINKVVSVDDNKVVIQMENGIKHEIKVDPKVKKEIKSTSEKVAQIKKEIETVKKTEAEEKENRSQAMKGNKNAYKGGPEDREITKAIKKELKIKPVLKGMAISTDLLDNGRAELMGRSIKDSREMAAIAQVFRDPRYETIRYVLTKKDKVVAHLAVTSKMPALALVSPKKPGEKQTSAVDFLSGKMKEHSADGYYLIHNHPSGDPNASDADINITGVLASAVLGFKDHIIINSNKYASIKRGKGGRFMQEINDLNGGKDEILKPSLDHPLLGQLVNSQQSLAEISKDFQNSDKYFTLVGADNKLKTRTILEMPMDMTKNNPASRKAFESFLRTHTRETGSNHFFIAGLDNNASNRKFLANAEHHGLILDAHFNDNKILSEMGQEKHTLIDGDKTFSDLPEKEVTGYLTEEKPKEPKKVTVQKQVKSEKKSGNIFDKEFSEIKELAESKKITPEQIAEDQKKSSYDHKGYKIYPSLYRDGIKWVAQSTDHKEKNTPVGEGMGDSVHKSKKEAEEQIDWNIKSSKSKKKAEESLNDQEKKQIEREKEYKNIDGFADKEEKLKKGRILKYLNESMNYQGKPYIRKELIREKIKKGWKIGKSQRHGKILEDEEGSSFLTKKDITKTAIDYAEYLISRKDLEKSIKQKSPQLKSLEQKEELSKSLEKQKALKEKRKRRKKRKGKK